MGRIGIALSLLVAFTGCSLVLDPGVHTSGMDAGGVTDGSTADGDTADGGDDAGPPGIALADLCPTLAEGLEDDC